MSLLHTCPKTYRAIMVSSTFKDLKAHRGRLITAIETSGYKANVMEFDGPRADLSVIEASLQLVRDSVAYVGIISRRYGQALFCPRLNPHRLSITELEFNEAVRLNKPIILFVMGKDHLITEADFEAEPEERAKLESFRRRSRLVRPGSEDQRVIHEFNSLEEFSAACGVAIGRLAAHLSSGEIESNSRTDQWQYIKSPSLVPPALVAYPPYIGSHRFVGRTAELRLLSSWCAESDPHPMLLFQAIGGTGKSMLAWEWTTRHAPVARENWAGRIWYSFYETGATMADFCRHVLSYINGKPVEYFGSWSTRDLSDAVFDSLDKLPLLVVLDGLERILVAYHRSDADILPDEVAEHVHDQMSIRHPWTAIRPEDDQLIRRFATVNLSKILISTRLNPIALFNKSNKLVPGVRYECLHGLEPSDAEQMLRDCGVKGKSLIIRRFLQENCDCHPLVTGAIAGLINDYLPSRGDFDAWNDDPQGGRALNFVNLDLTQRQTHILFAAVHALSDNSRKLLEIVSLLNSNVDFELLSAVYPIQAEESGVAALQVASASDQNRNEQLSAIVHDLERRGLIQYEADGRTFGLHPVIRAVVVGNMAREVAKERGKPIIDYFNSRPHDPWEAAETIADVEAGIELVRVLLKMERYDDALDALESGLGSALLVNLNAGPELQSLIRPFFPRGWKGDVIARDDYGVCYLLNCAMQFSDESGLFWALAERALLVALKQKDADLICRQLSNAAQALLGRNKLADSARITKLACMVAQRSRDEELLFATTFLAYASAVEVGNYEVSEKLWPQLSKSVRDWNREMYQPGNLQCFRALDLLHKGALQEQELADAETISRNGRNRRALEWVNTIRAEWYLALGDFEGARDRFADALHLARAAGRNDVRLEAQFIYSRLCSGESFAAEEEAEKCTVINGGDALAAAKMWNAIGRSDRAKELLDIAHRWAIADGLPFVHNPYLHLVREAMRDAGMIITVIPNCDRSRETEYSWEPQVRAFLDQMPT